MFQLLRQMILLACVAMSAVSSMAFANPLPPDQLVKQITQETYVYVNQDPLLQKGDTTKLIEWAEKSVVNSFDFQRMTRLAVGKDWRQATPEQQKQLVQEFRTLLIRTFANAFIGISKHQTIEYLPFKMNDDQQDVIVKTLILKPGKKPVDVNFSLEKRAESWHVYDVVLAGVSLITNYRESFTQEIRNNGIDGLINQLAEKNRQAAQKAKAS
jgi:phospholipid transport system substrate-binding protein